MFKQFRSPKGTDLRVTNLAGHVAIIGKDFRELPESLWTEAYAAGAISEDMTAAPSIDEYIQEKKLEQEKKEADELAELKSILSSLYDNPKDIVNSNGQLIHRKIIQFVGKPIKKDVIDTLWKEIVEEKSGE